MDKKDLIGEMDWLLRAIKFYKTGKALEIVKSISMNNTYFFLATTDFTSGLGLNIGDMSGGLTYYLLENGDFKFASCKSHKQDSSIVATTNSLSEASMTSLLESCLRKLYIDELITDLDSVL